MWWIKLTIQIFISLIIVIEIVEVVFLMERLPIVSCRFLVFTLSWLVGLCQVMFLDLPMFSSIKVWCKNMFYCLHTDNIISFRKLLLTFDLHCRISLCRITVAPEAHVWSSCPHTFLALCDGNQHLEHCVNLSDLCQP